MQLFIKNKGAVSVFLAIILVPIITVTSVFVDASRLRMAESVLVTSADLTLETVLAKYDAELNDFYGLMASCQDIESFLNETNDYLVTAMTSQGLSKTEATSLISQVYSGQTSSRNIVDLIQMSLSDDTTKVVSKVEGANLTNAAIVKKQISDFMKYRAPINIAAELVSKFINIQDQAEQARVETDLVDKKNDFFETESELLDTAFKVYENWENYVACFGGRDHIKMYLANMKKNLASYKERYKQMHIQMFKDLYNSQKTQQFVLKHIKKRSEYVASLLPYNDKTMAATKDIKKKVDELRDAYDGFIKAKDALDKADTLDYVEGETYKLQYWVQSMEIFGNSTENNLFAQFADAANEMIKKYVELENMVDYPADASYGSSVINTITKETLEAYITSVKKNADTAINYAEGSNIKYQITGAILEDCSQEGAKYVSTGGVEGEINKIFNEIDSYKESVKSARYYAKKINDGCKKVKKLLIEYREKLAVWKASAESAAQNYAFESGDDSMANNDLNEMEEDFLDQLDEEKVEMTRLKFEKIYNLLDALYDNLSDYKYQDKELTKIKSYNSFRSASKIIEAEIVLNNTQLEKNAENSFSFTEPEYLAIDGITDENTPDVTVVETEFEIWLEKHFKDYKNKKSKSKSDVDEITDQGEEKAKNASRDAEESNAGCSTYEIYALNDKPSDDDKSKSSLKNASEQIKKIFKDFTVENNIERYYALDYIMSMFTYDTYLYEGLYKNRKSLGYSGTPTTLAEARDMHENTKEAWISKEEDITFSGNKSLTNKVLNSKNNYSLGNEVEYILYGGKNADNKGKAYGAIYLIRYAMNTPIMFSKYWNDATLVGIAASISSATMGVVPEALIKIAIILALIAFESAVDLQMLKAGLPVKFIKKEDDLYFSFDVEKMVDKDSGKLMDSVTTNGESNSKITGVLEELNAFYYSTYLELFLMIKLVGTEESEIYQRTADVIQANMIRVTGEKTYVLANSQVYFKLDVKVDVPPLMLKLPINQVDNESWRDLLKDKYTLQYSAVKGY